MAGSDNGTAEVERIPSEVLRDSGRAWPDFFVGERVMVKGVVFQIVAWSHGGLLVKPYTKRVDESEAKRIVSDMIPKR